MTIELRSGKVLGVENTENKSEKEIKKERMIKTFLINEVDKSVRKSGPENVIEKPLVFTDKIVFSENFNKYIFTRIYHKYLTECNLVSSTYDKSYFVLQFMNHIMTDLPERRLWKEYGIDILSRVAINKLNEFLSYPEFNRCASNNNVDIENWMKLLNEISNVD